jgi:hypothetical protein
MIEGVAPIAFVTLCHGRQRLALVAGVTDMSQAFVHTTDRKTHLEQRKTLVEFVALESTLQVVVRTGRSGGFETTVFARSCLPLPRPYHSIAVEDVSVGLSPHQSFVICGSAAMLTSISRKTVTQRSHRILTASATRWQSIIEMPFRKDNRSIAAIEVVLRVHY